MLTFIIKYKPDSTLIGTTYKDVFYFQSPLFNQDSRRDLMRLCVEVRFNDEALSSAREVSIKIDFILAYLNNTLL